MPHWSDHTEMLSAQKKYICNKFVKNVNDNIKKSEQVWEESLVSVDNTKLMIHLRANYGDKSNSRSRRVLDKKKIDSMKKSRPLVTVHNIIRLEIAIISSLRFFSRYRLISTDKSLSRI